MYSANFLSLSGSGRGNLDCERYNSASGVIIDDLSGNDIPGHCWQLFFVGIDVLAAKKTIGGSVPFLLQVAIPSECFEGNGSDDCQLIMLITDVDEPICLLRASRIHEDKFK